MGELKIVSHREDPFVDRDEAGRLLGAELMDYAGRQTVVLGIPRGGVIVARQIAVILDCELDVVLSHKIGAPGNPELAIGSISEEGKLFMSRDVDERLGSHAELTAYVQKEREKQFALISERIERYRRERPKVTLEGRTVIIADDGLATGATMEASVWTTRSKKPEKIVVAVPVASLESAERVAEHADLTLVLKAPPIFYAVGQFYEYFSQTTDEEVLAALQERMRARGK